MSLVESIRKFPNTQQELGVGYDVNPAGHGAWFVFDRPIGESEWNMHCGPYLTYNEGVDWINAIREEPTR